MIVHLQDLAASELGQHHVAVGEDQAESLHKQLFEKRTGERVLGPPLQKDNWGNLTDTCILEDHFQGLVRPGKVSPSPPYPPPSPPSSLCLLQFRQFDGHLHLGLSCGALGMLPLGEASKGNIVH